MSDSVGSVSVDVVPDARGWSEKLRAQLRDQTVAVKADADTAEANAELDKTARTRTAKIKADVSQFSQGASKLDQFVGNLRLLPALAIVAGSALIPLAGTLGGIAAALAAPLVIAGGGATLFAFLAGFAVKDTNAQLKAISDSQKRLDGLTKGTAAFTAEQKKLHDLQRSLSPQQRQFADAKSGLGAAFQTFIGGKAGVALLGPLTQGMKLLAQILPSLTPILVAAGGAFSTLLGDLGDAASSPGFDHFIKLVSGQVAHDILGFGHVLGSIASGLGGLFVQLDKKAGSSMVDQLVRLSGAFSDWANSDRGRKAVQDFLDYVHRVGPGVGDALGAIARATGHFIHALAPLGPPTLRVIQGIADAISAIPVPVLTALAGAFVGLVAFQKVGGFKGLGALGKLGALSGKGGILGTIAGKAGVVPVYVTNEGFGGGTGGGKGVVSKAASFFEKHPVIAGAGGLALAVTGLAASVGLLYVLAKREQAAPASPGYRNSPAGMSPAATRAFNQQRIDSNFASQSDFHSVSTNLDNLRGQASSASRAIDMIGPRAQASVGRAVRAVEALGGNSGPLSSLHAQAGRASQSLEKIGPNAQAGSSVAVKAIGNVKSILAAIHDKRVAVKADTTAAQSGIAAVQAALNGIDRVVNVHVNVTRNTNSQLAGVMAQHHARGGWVTGTGTGTSDSIPSWLSRDEFVVNARSAAQNRALLEQINSGQRTSYAPSAAGAGAGRGMVHTVINLDGQKIGDALTPAMDAVYHANQAYEQAVYG